MKIAVLILAHRGPKQINELVSSFGNDPFDCFIHVDRKSDIQKDIQIKPNVYLFNDEERISVDWAGISQVEATLSLLRKARATKDYDYYWLISGQDFPIKNHHEILKFFNEYKGSEFIDIAPSKNGGLGKDNTFDKRTSLYWPLAAKGRGFASRLLRKTITIITGGVNHTLGIFRRKNKTGLPFYFGSSWWCLSSSSVDWILDYLENHPEFVKFMTNTLNPDESFFQTLFMASPYKGKRKENLTYVHFEEGESSPKTLSMDFYDDIMESNKLVCRKVDMDADKEFFQKLLEIQR